MDQKGKTEIEPVHSTPSKQDRPSKSMWMERLGDDMVSKHRLLGGSDY